METVRQVGLELASELDLDTLLYSIATRAMALVGGSDSSVALFRPELKSLEWVVGIADQSYIGNTVQRGDGLSGKVWESGEVIMVDNYNTWEGHVAIYLKDGRDALVGVPIIGGKQFLGVLEVEDRAPHTYSASDAELLKLLAAQAAVAIQNASLHEQVQLHAQDLEERVNLRTSELETKNQELGSFSYSVSHDLKAPLRGIDGYSRLLLETHADKLDEEGKEFLTNIRLGVNQMSQLIDDLLAFSRLERKPASFEPVDLAALVQSIVAKQADDLRSRKIELIVEVPRIMVSTDMEGLSQALRNLIDNAIKFTRDVPKPRIEIGGAETEGAWELWVRDNGIGFDMQYHERIFEIFQRLQRSEDYPGTGIGLAIVRKTVQQMGGRVWAESAPGLGAKFYIEIPKQDA